MIAGKHILVVVPARGGSKGVKLKNLHPLLGIPLIAHLAPVVRELGYLDRWVVSTDHSAIVEAAQAVGIDAPFMRPELLSGDRIGDLDVLAHALEATEQNDGRRYDAIVMLQPTSPLRTPAHVDATVRKLIEGGWDAVWTVSPTDMKYHPLKQLTVAEDGAMNYFDPDGARIIARQQLTPVYHRNGAAYAFTRQCLLEQRTIRGTRTGVVVIDEPMVSIDTLEDFVRVEAALRERGAR
jgi:CMP-N,N'-diacetyllegionaminic acid synthase